MIVVLMVIDLSCFVSIQEILSVQVYWNLLFYFALDPIKTITIMVTNNNCSIMYGSHCLFRKFCFCLFRKFCECMFWDIVILHVGCM